MKRSFALELTSGAHALMMLTRMCQSVSLYGLSAYGSAEQGGYQVRVVRLELVERSGERLTKKKQARSVL